MKRARGSSWRTVPAGTGWSRASGGWATPESPTAGAVRAGRAHASEWDVEGGTVTPPTLGGETTLVVAEVEELLVEEISIDGLCGVY
ncbi:MAG: mycofactocin precursor [Actinobacteria bacterium 21-73-9]|nr:MAG: mycofactocin precursor [Actinobacteria bacterium 21-73-9]